MRLVEIGARLLALAGGMIGRVRDRAERWPRAINDACHWSRLRLIGLSKPVAMAAFAPLIGGLILFSDKVVQILLPSDLLPELTQGGLSKLKLTYFALFMIGLGALIFRIRCPDLIRDFESSRAYQQEAPNFTEIAKDRLFDEMAERIGDLVRIDIDESEGTEWKPLPELKARRRLDQIIVDRFLSLLRAAGRTMDWEPVEDDYPLQMNDRFGELNPEAVFYRAWPRTRVDRPFWLEVHAALGQHLGDCLKLSYEIDDESLRISRVACFGFYGAGFVVLGLLSTDTLFRVLATLI